MIWAETLVSLHHQFSFRVLVGPREPAWCSSSAVNTFSLACRFSNWRGLLLSVMRLFWSETHLISAVWGSILNNVLFLVLFGAYGGQYR
jgi:hypothetical protein